MKSIKHWPIEDQLRYLCKIKMLAQIKKEGEQALRAESNSK